MKRQEPGGRKDDTCDHGLSRSWTVKVCEKKKKKAVAVFLFQHGDDMAKHRNFLLMVGHYRNGGGELALQPRE